MQSLHDHHERDPTHISFSDFNFVRNGDKCVPTGPEPIAAGICPKPNMMYKGSSGWRKIPGNTCTGGTKDALVDKPCSSGV